MSTSGIGAYNQFLISGAVSASSSTQTGSTETEGATASPTRDNPFLGNTNWDCENLLKLINAAQKPPSEDAEGESSASSTVTASLAAMVGF